MLGFEEARNKILGRITPLGYERVQLVEAIGRVLAEEVAAPWDMPRMDNSAMDGYAVRSEDCRGPVTLDISGYQPAGTPSSPKARGGSAYRIMTGASIPEGCDTVVPLEEAEEQGGRVKIPGPVEAGTHVRLRGKDVREGDRVLSPGSVLRPPEISMLASFGRAFVSVYRRARVAILSTGDELIELGESPSPGKIFNSNSLSVAAAVKECGAEPVLLGIAADEREILIEKLREGLRADVLVTSAGVSVGDRDLVRGVLEELGVEPVFWKARIKPGKPFAFGVRDGRPVFSLPGNPVSAMITFEELVRPALLKIMGSSRVLKPGLKATLTAPIRKKTKRLEFVRVRIEVEEGEYVVRASGDQSSGILKTMVAANGIAVLPEEKAHFEKGERVDIHLLYQQILVE